MSLEGLVRELKTFLMSEMCMDAAVTGKPSHLILQDDLTALKHGEKLY